MGFNFLSANAPPFDVAFLAMPIYVCFYKYFFTVVYLWYINGGLLTPS